MAVVLVRALAEADQLDDLACLLLAIHPWHCKAAVSVYSLESRLSVREVEGLLFLLVTRPISTMSDDVEKVLGFGFSAFVLYYWLCCYSYSAGLLCLPGRNSEQLSPRRRRLAPLHRVDHSASAVDVRAQTLVQR